MKIGGWIVVLKKRQDSNVYFFIGRINLDCPPKEIITEHGVKWKVSYFPRDVDSDNFGFFDFLFKNNEGDVLRNTSVEVLVNDDCFIRYPKGYPSTYHECYMLLPDDPKDFPVVRKLLEENRQLKDILELKEFENTNLKKEYEVKNDFDTAMKRIEAFKKLEGVKEKLNVEEK